MLSESKARAPTEPDCQDTWSDLARLFIEVNRPDRSTRRRLGKSDPVDAEMAARSVLAGVARDYPKSGLDSVEMIRMLLMVMTCPPRTGPGVMLVLGLKERGVKMARRKHTAEQIINKLREAEVAISAGSTVAEVSRQIGVTQQTFYRWRTEYGGLKIDQARRLKQLETENGRLRRAVADLTLDDQILREAAEGNF